MTEYKLAVLGEPGVGKTALIVQLTANRFLDDCDPTIEDSYRKQVTIDDQVCLLDVLDSAGRDESAAMRKQFLATSAGFLCVYAVTDKSSFDRLDKYRQEAMQINDSAPVLVVGNKCDLDSQRQVPTSEGQSYADSYGLLFFETSAKARINVEESFYSLIGRSVAEAAQRLSCRDPTLTVISLIANRHTDAELAELADCLLAHPDVAKIVYLGRNQLTDETGVKLARYIAASSTVHTLDAECNQFGEATYLALAAALHVNTSLQHLHLFDNPPVDQARVDAAFVDALRLNPHRSAASRWQLYAFDWLDVDFKRLKHAADQLGHPPMQLLLNNSGYCQGK